MRFLPKLFDNNREWAAEQVARDPQFFDRLCNIQRPDYLWIGCSDSRVPANTIVGLARARCSSTATSPTSSGRTIRTACR